MSYFEIEKDGKTLKFEYNRKALVRMEGEGYNALKSSEKMFTNLPIMIWGAMLMHQPQTTKTEALEVLDYVEDQGGLADLTEALGAILTDAFTPNGNLKIKIQGKKVTA